MTTALEPRNFVEKLRAIGVRAYHDKHPFHVAMNEGRLSAEALRGWVANRFYYQRNIPIKDAAILSNCPVREVRRVWIHRILDHDGVSSGAVESAVLSGETAAHDALETAHTTASEGGIEAWLRLGEACGLSRDELMDNRHLLPGVRFAVDAYVNFARTQPWPIAIASSLTELFAPDLMATRLAAFEKFYSVDRSLADLIIFAAESRRRGAILTMRSAITLGILQHAPSFRTKPCAPSSSSAMCSGRCSMRFIRLQRLGDRRSSLENARRNNFRFSSASLAKGVRLQIDSVTR